MTYRELHKELIDHCPSPVSYPILKGYIAVSLKATNRLAVADAVRQLVGMGALTSTADGSLWTVAGAL